MRLDPGRGVREVQVAGLDHVPDAVEPAPHLRQLRLNAREFPALLVGHPVQLLLHQPHQGPDVALRQNAVPDLRHNQALEAPALDQPTEQVGAGRPAGVDLGWPSGRQQGRHPPELCEVPATADRAALGLERGAQLHWWRKALRDSRRRRVRLELLARLWRRCCWTRVLPM